MDEHREFGVLSLRSCLFLTVSCVLLVQGTRSPWTEFPRMNCHVKTQSPSPNTLKSKDFTYHKVAVGKWCRWPAAETVVAGFLDVSIFLPLLYSL